MENLGCRRFSFEQNTARNGSKYGVISGPYFPAYFVSLRIQSESGKITPYLDTFHAVIFTKEDS